MLVKCPVCQAEYQLEPGKYKCACGAKFFVLENGGVSLSDPGTAAGNSRTNVVDPDRTMAPQTRHDSSKSTDSSFDPERTVPNIRIRHERAELQPGDVILGRYELLEKLGSGAMGVVFKCRDRISGVEYALKMVPPELVRDTEAMEDVRENFRLVHGLKHQNIASMDFLDRDEYGSYFLIMEYVQGESLTQWIKKKWRSGRPDPAEVIHIVKQIASALDYAHGQQILHRDIKPANVMVDGQGNVKVLDFGLASKVRSTMTALSVTTSNTSGTPHYLSPEQFQGKYPRPASDQYALGVLTYQMFAGHLPFEADDFNILSRAVLHEEPDPIDGIPPAIESAIQRSLRKTPKERFENCIIFANTLAAGLAATVSPETNVKKNIEEPPNLKDLSPKTTTSTAQEIVSPPAAVTTGNPGGSDSLPANVQTETVPLTSNTSQEPPSSASITNLPNGDIRIGFPGGVELTMVKIKAGTFLMGSPEKESGRDSQEKQHLVTLTEDYWLGKFAVTQGHWKAVMGNNPSRFQKGDNYPVEYVSWNDARKFCIKLNELCASQLPERYRFDLPTEAQWEYACRAGTTTALNNGKDLNRMQLFITGVSPLNEIGWYEKNSDSTHEVGKKRPNAWDLFDMHGNVLEWCLDWYGSYDGNATDPTGPVSGEMRVARGGCWDYGAKLCRSANRSCYYPSKRDNDVGFRLALVPGQMAEHEGESEHSNNSDSDKNNQERSHPKSIWETDVGELIGEKTKKIFWTFRIILGILGLLIAFLSIIEGCSKKPEDNYTPVLYNDIYQSKHSKK